MISKGSIVIGGSEIRLLLLALKTRCTESCLKALHRLEEESMHPRTTATPSAASKTDRHIRSAP